MPHNPNFPANLDIRPSTRSETHATDAFDFFSQEEAIREYGIAGRVWEAAYFLNTYIEGPAHLEFDPPFLTDVDERHPPTILELGSGTGIVSAQCAERLSGRKCTIVTTDLPEVCPLLEKNLHQYQSQSHGAPSSPTLLVRPLAWGNHDHALAILRELQDATPMDPPSHPGPHALSHIICSDLVYFPELLAPLLRTLLQLSSPPIAPADADAAEHAPIVLIAYKIRSLAKETPFWAAFGLWFSFAPVLVRPRGRADGISGDAAASPHAAPDGARWARFGTGGEDDVFVFVARRRPGSHAWVVPADDAALLAGVGARGDEARKADDTFETLLLMGLSSE